MAYDDLKEFDGHRYTGMAVGGQHEWVYPHGVWEERKVAPDKWEFTFSSTKKRTRSAPIGSGVPPNTQYHWYILADQKVRKVDEDSYETLMAGVKYKIAHKRPHWRKWSSEYPDQPSAQERILAVLEETIWQLRNDGQATEATRRIITPPPRFAAISRPRAGDLSAVRAGDAIVEE